MTEAQELLKRFADSARSGAQGVSVDCDTAQALAQAIDQVLGDLPRKARLERPRRLRKVPYRISKTDRKPRPRA